MSTKLVNGSRPIKRSRRTSNQMMGLRMALMDLVNNYKPMTCRQIFYQAVTRGLIDKTEQAYKALIRVLGVMRNDQEMPFHWIADSTRWQRKPDTYVGLESMLHEVHRTYRRAVWADQGQYVEVWLEKDALAGVLVDVTAKWDVPLMVTKGYPSITYIHSAARMIDHIGKPTYIYYFGDLDPSGVDIPRVVEAGLRKMAPKADITFERVAVSRDQVEEYGLQTRPTKKTDTRSKNFSGESVEVDAIEPDELRRIAGRCITQHLDYDVYDRMLQVEEAERETLATIAANLRGAA
jgi:hypothetical protein